MNGDGKWHTKDNVLDDLAKFNGLRQADIPDEYIVRGNKAPRQRRTDDDDEIKFQIEMICGGQGDGVYRPSYFEESQPPDLAGIQTMIEMARTFEEEQEQGKKTVRGRHGDYIAIPEKPKTKFVISKLDPNVKEFIPKSAQAEIKSNSSDKSMPEEVKSNEAVSKTEEVIPVDDTAKEALVDERLKKEVELKNRILKASKTDTVVAKRDRNAAISALMKLKAASQAPSDTASENCSQTTVQDNSQTNSSPHEQLVLHPPAYFETWTPNINIKQNSNPPEIKISKPTANDEPETTNTTPAPPKPYNTKPTTPKTLTIDPEIRESIKKVENWLDKPKKKDPVYPNLSPITFKRKQCSTPSSASETKPEANTKSEAIPSVPRYVPSKYANELYKRYSEKAKRIEDQGLDIWAKLERDLKARDKEIYKQRQMEKEQSDSRRLNESGSSSEMFGAQDSVQS